MKKKILSIILSISLLFTMLSITSIDVFAAGHPSHNGVDSWAEFTTTLPTNPGNYYLANDITLSGTWTVPTGTTNLCLNGHVINADGGNFSVITVPSGATLNLYDCNSTISHAGYADDNNVWHLGSGTGTSKSISGGIITGSISRGVSVTGTFNMYGGTIAGNKVTGHGGGIYIAGGGQVNMINGTIENNYCTVSGGALQVDGTFNMSGGVIQNNKANNDGGAISDNGILKLTGTAKIINNIAVTGKGGGVNYYGNINTVTIGNKVQIVDNEATNNTNNFHIFYNDRYISLGTGGNAPEDGMSVGITINTEPTLGTQSTFTTNGTENYVDYFFSSNLDYVIDYDSGHLVLLNPTAVALNSTKRDSYSTLVAAVALASIGDVIKLYQNNNSENIILPDGVILYTKSNYLGTVSTNISGKVIVRQDGVGDYQWKFSVADAPAEDNPSSNSDHIVLNTGVGNVSTNN